jgi:hypothetical protein
MHGPVAEHKRYVYWHCPCIKTPDNCEGSRPILENTHGLDSVSILPQRKHLERLVCNALAFISEQARECRLGVSPISVHTPMYFDRLPYAKHQVTQRFTNLD